MIRKTVPAIAISVLTVASIGRADISPPPGLAPSDQFRLIFVSSTSRDATSSNIAHYDALLNGVAGAAGLDVYNRALVSWFALGTTASVSAIDRLPDSGVPIYNMAGDLIADATHDIWSGSILHPVAFTETGGAPGYFVRTGTYFVGSQPPFFIGGRLGDSGPLIGTAPAADLLPFYGYSEVTTVAAPTALPEPGTITLGLAPRALRSEVEPKKSSPAALLRFPG